ncbi:hypothetical protein PPL_02664 [Heterostelium album PN500]|uniref:Uncharacterized protein n=1 Tax=Heterostelium pallidum (strain ATCC 26659 / Pp 5 / PN500) TaxID=670386 RepID=D3B2Q0_HETP5|nr:hypothetical protein PPL_02664 [Heterostelium album PN500]EFA83598.1 hypothetical protein PPL_02664 [Heterostelium album PN500]|eukprot:XP_020435715.1 hypothetical protein PPL_02664 [Heterostelium album PN500]
MSNLFSALIRRTVLPFQQQCSGAFLTTMRAEPKKGAPAGKGAVKKKAGGAPKKKKNDRGNTPLQLEKVAPQLFTTKLPQNDSDYPDWLYEIEEQLPRDQPVKILTPADGGRYFKQQNRKKIKLHNEIMLATKGKGL